MRIIARNNQNLEKDALADDCGQTRRHFLTGAAAIATAGVVSGRAMADDRPIKEEGGIVDLDYDGGTLYPGETETVQRVKFDFGAEVRVERLDNLFLQGGSSIEKVRYSFDDDSVPDAVARPRPEFGLPDPPVRSLSELSAEQEERRTDPTQIGTWVESTLVPDGTELTIDVTIVDDPTEGPLWTVFLLNTGGLFFPGSIEEEPVGIRQLTPTETGGTESGLNRFSGDAEDGTPEQISESPPSSRDAEFSLVADQPSYYDSIDGYERVTVTPEQPSVGEQVTVEVVVTNIGDGAGTYHARLDNYFTIFGSQDVELEPGEKTTLEFTFSFDKAGTHQLFLTNDRIAEVVVTE